MRYVIVVDYYMWDDEKGDYTAPLYLGVDEDHIFVFDDNICKRTEVFSTAKEAGEYVDKHFKEPSMCFEHLRIMQAIRRLL